MLKWAKNSKSMSGSYSMKGTAPAGVTRVKKGSLSSNGNGPPPLSYPADPPDDENMNEIINENVELTVHLPDGSKKQQIVESTIPMMDLLITLAASNKLNPAAHSLVVLTGDKWKQIDFKANKTIGSLAGEDGQVSVQVIKKKVEEKFKQKSTAQPFEMTYRFTVNLPHKQKKVLRISPKLTLGEIRQILCQDKKFDPDKYVFMLPGSQAQSLDDNITVGDLKTSEIDFVAAALLEAATARSMPDLAMQMSRHVAEEKPVEEGKDLMPSAGEKKAKKGFLSFLSKKDKKFKVQQEMSSIEAPRRKSDSFHSGARENARPHTMYADSGELEHFDLRRTTGDLHKHHMANRNDFRKSTGGNLMPLNENVSLGMKSDTIEIETVPKTATTKPQTAADTKPKKSGKKRAAPPPPQAQKPQTVQVEIEVNPKQEVDNKVDLPEVRVPTKKLHSRNSSDSSGYHELTVSGADSPDGVKLDNLQTTLDTTSIDSLDHFNGDSGIRDMSPVHRRNKNRKGKEISSRDSSLEITEISEPPIAPGRKKKRAPLPPPGMSACSIKVSNETKPAPGSPTVTVQERRLGNQEDEEFSALQAMEEVTMKFNIDDSEDEDDDMKMVENSSIHSEDLDVSHRQRPPATFIAPPPPTEPPPEDSEVVDYNMVVSQVSTIDIGVGEDTTSLSPSNSSKGTRSRRSSASSNASVNTLEDLSLAFKQTIAMGEEALGFESDNDDNVQEELKKAMPEFKDHIAKLADEDPDNTDTQELSNRTNQSDQGTDSDTSFIVHEKEVGKENGSEASFDMQQDSGMPETSEITYNYTVDSVPADFQNEAEDKPDSEDEEVVTEEIVEYYPARPDCMEMGSPRRIPDLDSPKEHRSLSLPMHEVISDIPVDQSAPVDKSTPKDIKQQKRLSIMEALEQERKIEEDRRRKREEEAKNKQKEEFVITLDELTNVDFSATKPGEQKRQSTVEPPKVNYRIEFRSSRDFSDEPVDFIQAETASEVESEPLFSEQEDNNNVKTKCSDISFTPSSEGEVEHVLEEKSISMIALPAERTPVKQYDNSNYDDSPTYTSSAKVQLLQNSAGASPSSDFSPRRDDSFETQNMMQAQYQQLQSQFTMWQSQLNQNQQLLATQDDQSNLQLQQLQLQIQMQQQMLLQLQQSMHSLAMQNTLAAQQQQYQHVKAVPVEAIPSLPVQAPQPVPLDSNMATEPSPMDTQVPAAPEPPPAPAPPPAAKSKPVKADAKYSKPKQKKFERQLDPREKLMLDIRNFGKTGLKKVPVKATHWHQ